MATVPHQALEITEALKEMTQGKIPRTNVRLMSYKRMASPDPRNFYTARGSMKTHPAEVIVHEHGWHTGDTPSQTRDVRWRIESDRQRIRGSDRALGLNDGYYPDRW